MRIPGALKTRGFARFIPGWNVQLFWPAITGIFVKNIRLLTGFFKSIDGLFFATFALPRKAAKSLAVQVFPIVIGRCNAFKRLYCIR